MPNKRAEGKKLIGAMASAELWTAVDAWLRANPHRSVTDFLLDACIEKLHRAGISVDQASARRDHRARVPAPAAYPRLTGATVLNETSSTASGTSHKIGDIISEAARSRRRGKPSVAPKQ